MQKSQRHVDLLGFSTAAVESSKLYIPTCIALNGRPFFWERDSSQGDLHSRGGSLGMCSAVSSSGLQTAVTCS